MEDKLIMKEATKRSIVRWIHIVFSIPILGYIYSPFEEIPKYAPRVRFVVVPAMLLSGLWMWKGHVLRRLIQRDPPARMKMGQEFEA
jgi:hypothetical protein